MLGQRADSHTVCRFRRRSSVLRPWTDWKWVVFLRSHSGSRGRAGEDDESWTRASGDNSIFSHDRIFESGSFEGGARLGLRCGILERADQNPEHAFFRSRRHDGVETLLAKGFGDDLGIRAGGRHHLPIFARREVSGDSCRRRRRRQRR